MDMSIAMDNFGCLVERGPERYARPDVRKPTHKPPSDFFVLLDEEFGFALWFWVQGMPGGALECD